MIRETVIKQAKRHNPWIQATSASVGLHLGLFVTATLWLHTSQHVSRRAIPVRLMFVAAAHVDTKLLPRKGATKSDTPPLKTKPKPRSQKSTPPSSPALNSHAKKAPLKSQAPPSSHKHSSPSAMDRLSAIADNWGEPRNSEQARDSVVQLNQQLQEDYLQRVQASIQKRYRLPATLSATERARLKTVLRLHIDRAGRVAHASILTPSSNPGFDDTVLRAARQTNSFGPPPTHLARAYKKDGVVVEFCPIDCSLQE